MSKKASVYSHLISFQVEAFSEKKVQSKPELFVNLLHLRVMSLLKLFFLQSYFCLLQTELRCPPPFLSYFNKMLPPSSPISQLNTPPTKVLHKHNLTGGYKKKILSHPACFFSALFWLWFFSPQAHQQVPEYLIIIASVSNKNNNCMDSNKH